MVMDNKYFIFYIGILFLVVAVVSILGFDIWIPSKGWVDLSSQNILIHTIMGIICIFFSRKIKPPTHHSICPKCKETYLYKDLKDGKCPTCKVNTIDIDKYYNNKSNKGKS